MISYVTAFDVPRLKSIIYSAKSLPSIRITFGSILLTYSWASSENLPVVIKTPFFALFWRYWDDWSYKVYLGSNFQVYDDHRVKTLAIGKDKSWSHGLLEMVERIDTPYIICMLDDFFLRNRVSIKDVMKCFEALNALNGKMVRLVPRPPPDTPVPGYPFFGINQIGLPL